MTKSDANIITDYFKSLSKEDTARLLAQCKGRPARDIVGVEYGEIWDMLHMHKPVSTSNNQRVIADEYHINDKKYVVHYGLGDSPVIQEILPETN